MESPVARYLTGDRHDHAVVFNIRKCFRETKCLRKAFARELAAAIHHNAFAMATAHGIAPRTGKVVGPRFEGYRLSGRRRGGKGQAVLACLKSISAWA